MNHTQTITFHEIQPGDERPAFNCHLALAGGGMTWGRWLSESGYWSTAVGPVMREFVTHWAPPLKHPAQVEDAK